MLTPNKDTLRINGNRRIAMDDYVTDLGKYLVEILSVPSRIRFSVVLKETRKVTGITIALTQVKTAIQAYYKQKKIYAYVCLEFTRLLFFIIWVSVDEEPTTVAEKNKERKNLWKVIFMREKQLHNFPLFYHLSGQKWNELNEACGFLGICNVSSRFKLNNKCLFPEPAKC